MIALTADFQQNGDLSRQRACCEADATIKRASSGTKRRGMSLASHHRHYSNVKAACNVCFLDFDGR